jgi:hypothetical protein
LPEFSEALSCDGVDRLLKRVSVDAYDPAQAWKAAARLGGQNPANLLN